MRLIRFAVLIAMAATAIAATAAPDDREIVSRIPRMSVESSAIAGIGYSKRLHALEVEFRNGAIYRYFDVPPKIFHELLAAPSKTAYYDTNVRGHFHSIHVKTRS